MTYNKLPQNINNFISDNVKALAQLFPSAVKDGQVDFTALKEELGHFEEVGKEKYELTWSGKQNAKKKAQEDVYNRTLKYIEKDSKNPDTTENLYIEGDNLEVLKLLRQNYYGAIKMIYIDPPYNTGNDFVYNDNFAMGSKESDIAEGARDNEGNPLQKNQKSTNRYHANWLNMMYPRIKVAKDLLTDDGVIFISIDDNEVDNLKKICNDVFGEDNFIEEYVWESTFRPDNSSNINRKNAEYILCFAKNKSSIKQLIGGISVSDGLPSLTKNSMKESTLRFKAGIVTTFLKDGIYEKGEKGSYVLNDTVEVFDGKIVTDFSLTGRVIWGQTYLDEQVNSGTEIIIKNESFVPYTKKAEPTIQSPNKIVPKNKVGDILSANSERSMLFDTKIFEYPKPITLIKYFLSYFKDKNFYTLDFFSGSGTTAHAVMQLNAEDGGNRKFIMVQVPEETDENSEAYKAGYKNICEIGKERIRRAGEKIKEEVETANEQLKLGEEPKPVPDIGFKVFRTADTNIKWNLYDEIAQIDTETMVHTPDLADFTLGAKDVDIVYEIMLRQKDVPLSAPLEILYDIGERTYLYGYSYLVCLETDITKDMVEKLASLDPLPIKFVFRDSAFKDDINLKDETFRRLKTLIDKNAGETKPAYTVEFI